MKRRKSHTVKDPGAVSVRVYKRGDTFWFDVRLDATRRKRTSAHTSDRKVAETRAVELAKAIAEQRGKVITKTDTVTLAEMFRLYHELYRDEDGRAPEGQWKRAGEARTKAFLSAWGGDTPVVSISQTSVGQYCDYRQRAWRAKRKDEKAMLRPGALDCDFRWLASVLNWGTIHKLPDGSRLLARSPLKDCTWAKEKAPQRPIATEGRYLATLQHVDTVDPRGRLRTILAIARHTARRVDAVCNLWASDVLLSPDRIVAALADAGGNVAEADDMPHGALRWRAATDKMDMTRISAISPETRAALERYLAANPRLGDVPLFPADHADGEDRERPVSRHTANHWLLRAEGLAGVPKLRRGLWHPYRRLWATERKHLPDVDVAAAGGWSGTKAMKLAYQQPTSSGKLVAVLNTKPNDPTPNEGTPRAQSG